jgi:hypothetical protein
MCAGNGCDLTYIKRAKQGPSARAEGGHLSKFSPKGGRGVHARPRKGQNTLQSLRALRAVQAREGEALILLTPFVLFTNGPHARRGGAPYKTYAFRRSQNRPVHALSASRGGHWHLTCRHYVYNSREASRRFLSLLMPPWGLTAP